MGDITVRPYYQRLTESGRVGQLPAEWEKLDCEYFSDNKTLYQFQQSALKNGLKLFNEYVSWTAGLDDGNIDAKKKLADEVDAFAGGILDEQEFKLQKRDLKDAFAHLNSRYEVNHRSRYGYDYEEVDFYNLANRMGFWMATGSGKTLVAIKLIEQLHTLAEKGEIPDKDFLLLTHRDDILDQFEEEISEYNQYNDHTFRTWDVRNYGEVKRGGRMGTRNAINVFTYRSDNITDETKQKQLSFEDIENNGEWYLLLDEAHKGNTSTSKRQAIYSMLTRNGFLFNFSATFTDPLDILTTVYNYNIERFTSQGGFGKNILISDQDLSAISLGDANGFDTSTKGKIVLKSLIALTSQKMAKGRVEYPYHDPLLTAFVNSVNTTDSDLEMFFNELEKIAKKRRPKLFKQAKNELKTELEGDVHYAFSEEEPEWLDISSISKNDVLREVYNANTHSSVEVRHSTKTKKELVFKLKSSTQPFALMRIGNNAPWLNNKLKGRNVEEEYDFKSYFEEINNPDSTINLLLGSRSFYEGWDSNRPNVMLFINLGKSERRKFIMQSLGRGMRIEPKSNERRRLRYLKESLPADQSPIKTIETLLVFGTSVDNLRNITDTVVKMQETAFKEVEGIKKSSEASEKHLLVPQFSKTSPASVTELAPFDGDSKLLESYTNWLKESGDDRLILAQGDIETFETLSKFKNFISNGQFSGVKYDEREMVNRLASHVQASQYKQDGFDIVRDRIIHFEKIEGDFVAEGDKEELETLIEKVRETSDETEEELVEKYEEGEITLQKYTERVQRIGGRNREHFSKYNLNIENLAGHYYAPVIYADQGQADSTAQHFREIIDVDSEIAFLKDLAEKIENGNPVFPDSDWWMFSKVSENFDDIYLPYDNVERFRPDFIFWINQESNYHITFVDPKATSFTNYQRKIDGYERLFTDEERNPRIFQKDGLEIKTHLRMYTDNPPSKLPKQYASYWVDDVSNLPPSFS